MFSKIKNIPKKILISVGVLSLIILVITISIFNLEKTISLISDTFIGPDIKIEKIDFSKDEITLKNLKMYDDDNNLMVDFPLVKASYKKSLKDFKIKNIDVNSGAIYVARDKDGDVNFVTAFTGKKEKKIKTEKEIEKEKKELEEKIKNYKPASSIPIENINLENIKVNYKDYGYREVIEKTLEKVSGNVKFDKEKGMHIVLNADKPNREKINYIYSDEKEPYWMQIKVQNLNLDDNIGQYMYDSEKMKYLAGEIETDFIISSNGMYGDVQLKNAKLKYEDFDEEIKDVNAKILFDKNDIDIFLAFNLFDEKNEIVGTYKNEEFNMGINYKNLDKFKLLKVKQIREANINLDEVDIKNIDISLHSSKKEGFLLKTKIDPNLSKINGIIFKDIVLNFRNKDKKNFIEDSYILLNLYGVDEKIKFNMEQDGIYSKFNVNAKADEENSIIPDIDAKINLKNEKEKLMLEAKTNILNFKLDYDKKNEKTKIYDKDFLINYDNGKKEILDAKGKLPFHIYDIDGKLDFLLEKDIFNIKNITLEKGKNKILSANGKYFLKTRDIDLNYEAKDFKISRNFNGKKVNLELDSKGNLTKKANNYFGNGRIDNLSLEYIGKISKIRGDYEIKNSSSNNLEGEFYGEIGELGYDKYFIRGLKTELGYKDNILNIFNIENRMLEASGEIDFNKNDSDISFELRDIKNEDINFPEDKIKLELESLKGKVSGDIKNPYVDVNLEKLFVNLANNSEEDRAQIFGNIFLKDKKIYFNDLNLDANRMQGEYDLNSGKYNAKINIIEEKLFKYYSYKNLRYRIISTVNVNGEKGNLKADIEGNVDKVFFDKEELPNLYFKANYLASNYSDGILNLSKISVLNNKKENLFDIFGKINLKDKKLDLLVDKQKLDLKKLEKYTKVDYLSGILNLNSNLNGTFDKPEYKLSIDSNEIKIKDVPFTNLDLFLRGNLQKVSLEKMQIYYLKNLFSSQGYYDISNKYYDINMKSDNINLDFLNNFLAEKGVKDVSGDSSFNITFKTDKTQGYIKANNFNLNAQKQFLKLQDISSTVKIVDNRIILDNLGGKINSGNFNLKGYADIPNLFESRNEEILKKLDYKIDFKLKDFDYIYPDVLELYLNSDLLISKNKLDGEISIEKGKVMDIPNNYKSVWSILKNYLFSSKVVKSEEEIKKEKVKNEYEIKKILENLMPINLDIVTKNPIILDVEKLNLVVEDLRGKVYSDLNIRGKEGKYSIFGEVEAKETTMYINGNNLIADRLLVAFNDKKSFLPDLNPQIFVETRIGVNADELNFNINGRLDKLRYSLASSNGRTSGDLKSLLNSSDSNIDTTNEAYITFIKNLIGGQIADTVVGPITRVIKKTFNFSKLKLKPDVSFVSSDERTSKKNKDLEEGMNVGAILEVEDNIYKDKVFWNANARISGANKFTSSQKNKKRDSGIREYDVNLEYRYKDGKSIGVGVGTVPEKYKDEDKDYDKPNYHVDFKIRKKYNSFSEIFKFN